MNGWCRSDFASPPAGCGVDERDLPREPATSATGRRSSRQPRAVLRRIPGLRVIETAESNWCCGSAGIYNITQPEQSAKLLERKVGQHRANGRGRGGDVESGMPSAACVGLRKRVQAMCQTVTQPVSLLAEAYRNERSRRAFQVRPLSAYIPTAFCACFTVLMNLARSPLGSSPRVCLGEVEHEPAVQATDVVRAIEQKIPADHRRFEDEIFAGVAPRLAAVHEP